MPIIRGVAAVFLAAFPSALMKYVAPKAGLATKRIRKRDKTIVLVIIGGKRKDENNEISAVRHYFT
jgi:hypothetical protein